ncbi:hypothetical protein CIPAW_01G099100 [Carya illinoinensis]|uniref:Uncharacterized protein n=1 Tax=Carya illinoinensis TaxID=32201 RepID=A0A8T1RKS5_CARIL|nr:hypothetical protein CIPAW_01G099100 [Carya illinoinensis]
MFINLLTFAPTLIMCRSHCRRGPLTNTSPPHGCNSELGEGNGILVAKSPAEIERKCH